MQITDRFLRLPLTSIHVRRDVRQRRSVYDEFGQFVNTDGLLEDVAAHGVLNPLIVNEDGMVLIAGERRLEASRTLGLADVPVRFVSDLTELEAKKLELSENIKRLDIPWRDEVASVLEWHQLSVADDPDWSRDDTARELGYGQLAIALRVARDLANPVIAGATSVRMAFNILARRDDRTQSDALADIMEIGRDILPPSSGAEVAFEDLGLASVASSDVNPLAGTEEEPVAGPSTAPSESILHASFLEWAPLYTGPRFNLVHCDFPYSIGAFGGEKSGRDRWETYDDSRDTGLFDQLLLCLCDNLDRLVTPSAHLFFWLPADVEFQSRVLTRFGELVPSLNWWGKPLIWHKTDNVGILSDPKRKPRHVYETALVASREDRLIAQATSDCYGSQTNKEHHPSTKPEPMLRYFFQMFVDEHTRLLDPTCGSGTALRAAESLGASYVLGLEANAEHHANAVKALRKFRTLREASR